MRKSAIIVTAVVAAVLLVGGVTAAILFTRGSGSASSVAPAPTTGCTEGETEELYVQAVYGCPDGSKVYTFANTTARDDYLKIATTFGSTLVEQGDTWARVRG